MKLAWSAPAAADLLAIRRYVGQHDREAARRLVAEIRTMAQEAAEWPLAGRVVPEWGDEHIRERVVRSRYRLIYRTATDGIVILRVLEGHSLLAASGDEG